MGGAMVGDGKGTEEEKEGDRHPLHARTPPLFSRGCAHSGLRATAASRMHLANFETTQVGPTPQISAENFSFQQVRVTFQKGAWSV